MPVFLCAGLKQTTVCALMLVVLVSSLWNAEGRYLPTRSDNSRYEHIKEVLRALLDLNDADAQSPRQNYMYEDVLRSKRDAFKQHVPPPMES
ncbi:uncharacterized protein CDAR_543151 [Caerostris darwini]|uniref:Uncharacterized protein n=1 Tax=Caerostris darwini TaxID=1538125 RepID=A0AAV4X499_9ARAC|nr:uncharacterized protein CDAR_543151 [Caerostris darwini]